MTAPDYPPEIFAAIDAALDELPQPENRFERDRWRIVSRVTLDAAAPILRRACAADDGEGGWQQP